MNWVLKGISGPLKGKVFPLKAGLTLGRQGDIVIPDVKSSGIHARIGKSASGKWVLADNSSKNGTRIDGERIARATLVPGLQFFIGDQGFEVVEIKEEVTLPPPASPSPPPTPQAKSKARPKPIEIEVEAPAEVELGDQTLPPLAESPEPLPESVPTPAPPPPEKVRRYWHEILTEFLAKNEENFSERKRPISALTPAVVLEFVRGVQVNSKWTLGYGPRKIGPSVLDLPIWEPGAPAVCFELVPSGEGVVFKTNHPELVRINGEGVDSRVLHVGDTIRINETIIEVDFAE